MLVLFPAGGAGAALGPPLATRLGGPFASWCDILCSDAAAPTPTRAGRVSLVRLLPDGRRARHLDPVDIERPIVATLGAGRRPPDSGSAGALEIEILSGRSTGGAAPRAPAAPPAGELTRRENPFAHVELASVVVVVAEPDVLGFDFPVEALAARMPQNATVLRFLDVPRAVLARSCPDVLIKLGPSPVTTARSRRTRVVLVSFTRPDEPPPDDADIVWSLRTPGDVSVDALAHLLRDIGGAA